MSILKFLCKKNKKKWIFQLSLHVMEIERDIFFNHPLSLCNFALNDFDSLIYYCSTSSEQQLVYIQDENKVNSIQNKPTEKRRRGVSTEATTFHCHCRSMRSLEWARHLVFCSDYIAPILFRNLKKRSLSCRVRGPLQTRYPLWSTVWIFVLSLGDLLSATL